MWCILDKFIFLTLHFFYFYSIFIFVTIYISTFKKYRVYSWSSVCPHGIFSRFSWLFQLSEDLFGTHATGKQFLQDGFRLCFLRFLCGLSIFLCLIRFQGCHFFFGLLQSNLLFFLVSLQSVNVGGDGYNLSSKGNNRFLLLRDLRYVVIGGIGFWTVFTAFRSGHRDNLFPSSKY